MDYLIIKDAAALAKLSAPSLRKIIKRHKARGYGAFASDTAAKQFGRRAWMVDRKALERWIADPNEHRFGPNHLKIKRVKITP